jgi:hypothetical protein
MRTVQNLVALASRQIIAREAFAKVRRHWSGARSSTDFQNLDAEPLPEEVQPCALATVETPTQAAAPATLRADPLVPAAPPEQQLQGHGRRRLACKTKHSTL